MGILPAADAPTKDFIPGKQRHGGAISRPLLAFPRVPPMISIAPHNQGLGRGLYPLIDADACQKRGLDIVECARAVVDAGPPLVQLRAKERPAREVESWVEQIAHGLPEGGTRLIVNDRADIALFAGASGVHVGQSDLPARELVRRFPTLVVGLSTHDESQLEAALEVEGLGYVAFGPIFPTESKKNAEPTLSMERLRKAYALTQEKGRLLVAIGGITEDRLAEVSESCDFVAAISLLLPHSSQSQPYSWIRERSALLDRRVKGTR